MNSHCSPVSRPASAPAASSGATPASRLEQARYKALELFAERGFAQVGMRELAAHLGIRAGSLYHHFQSKESLLFELIEELYDELLEAAEYAAKDRGDARLPALLRTHIALHERLSLQFMVAEREFCCLSPQHQQRIRQMRLRYEDHVLALLLAGGATAHLPLLRATVQGVIAWLNNLPNWLTESSLPPTERQQVIVGIVHGALAGVLNKPPCDQGIDTLAPLRAKGSGP